MARKYYVLVVRETGDTQFRQQFGAYNRGEVAAELDDYRDHGYRVRDLWILESASDKQTDIDSMVEKFNANKRPVQPGAAHD